MKCFYHNDADGRCSAFWVKHFLGKILNIEFISMDYLKPFPLNIIEPNESIYIIDYSVDPLIMQKILEKTYDVTWIDHHKTAIEQYTKFELPELVMDALLDHTIRGVQYDGVAACMLTYCYLRHMTICGTGEIKPFEPWMTEDAPMFTKLIADWDTWTMKYGERTKQFITAFNAGDFEPNGKDWLDCPSLPTEKMIQAGKAMVEFRDGWARDYLSLGFLTYFEGYKCFALNLGRCSSEYFKSLQLGTYDIYIAFVFDGVQYSVSMYSQVVDVSEIAKKHSGGGHKGAAGFVCTNLPFSRAKEELK